MVPVAQETGLDGPGAHCSGSRTPREYARGAVGSESASSRDIPSGPCTQTARPRRSLAARETARERSRFRRLEGWLVPRCRTAGARGQQPAGSGKEEPVKGCYRRAAGLPPKGGQFVPQHDDFQLLPLFGPHPEGNELKKLPKQQVTERAEHDASRVAR